MSYRPSSRTSACSTSSGSSTCTCREERLPNFAAVHALVYFCGRDPRKVKAMRVYETTYLDNITLDSFETRSSVSSSKRSIHSGLSWLSSGSNGGRTKQEFYFIESRTGGYRSGAGYEGGEQQQPALVAAVKQWKPPKSGSERESRPSKRSSKSGGSHRHSHEHGLRGRQGPPSAISGGDEGKYEEAETDDGSGSGFDESVYQGRGPGGPGASPGPFPPGPPGVMPPPPSSYPLTGGYPGYHQQQPMYMGLPPPPMPPMTPHGHGGFHHPPHMPTLETNPPIMSGGGGGGGKGARFQQDGNGIQVFMPE